MKSTRTKEAETDLKIKNLQAFDVFIEKITKYLLYHGSTS